MILNTHPENRKEMVKAICELTGLTSTYMGICLRSIPTSSVWLLSSC